jgi:hypothetical protein
MPSRTFDFTGTIGRSVFPDAGKAWEEVVWATTPWEREAIAIVGVCLDLNVISAIPDGGPSAIEAFVGNNTDADQMTPRRRAKCAPGAASLGISIQVMYPPGFTFAFPGKGETDDPTDARSPGHIDCHVFGNPGLEFVGSITLFYRVASES